MSQCKHLDFLLVLEPALADDDVLDASPVSELLLEHGVEFEKFLRLLLRDSVQGIFINHPHALKLQRERKGDLVHSSGLKEGLSAQNTTSKPVSKSKHQDNNMLYNSMSRLKHDVVP